MWLHARLNDRACCVSPLAGEQLYGAVGLVNLLQASVAALCVSIRGIWGGVSCGRAASGPWRKELCLLRTKWSTVVTPACHPSLCPSLRQSLHVTGLPCVGMPMPGSTDFACVICLIFGHSTAFWIMSAPGPCACLLSTHTLSASASASASFILTCRVFEEPWWGCHLATGDCSFWAASISKQDMAHISLRARAGALNALEDFVKHLGRKLQPYLPLAFVLLLRMLGSVVEAEQVRSSTSQKVVW